LPSKRFLLHYPDRSRTHIGVPERDELLLSAKIRKINDFSYEYVGQTQTFHSFADLEPLRQSVAPMVYKRYLPGTFIFDLNKRRIRELMETPEGMAIRLQA